MKKIIVPLLAVILYAGEWVTTEDGVKICQTPATILTETPLSPELCTNWQIRKPVYGESIEQYRAWLRPGPGGGYQIHTERGWRP